MNPTPHEMHAFSNGPHRLFVDASHTASSGKNSGIERVVRNILSECGRWCGGEGLPSPQMVTHLDDQFRQIDSGVATQFSRLAALESNIYHVLPKWYGTLATWLRKHSRSQRLRRWFAPQPGHLGAFKLVHSAYASSIRRGLPTRALAITPNENDLFILPDAYWTKRGVWRAAAAARSSGAMVATMIYDLIPLTHPQYVGQKRTEGFRRYLHHAIENSDLLVSISQTVEIEIRQYIAKNRLEFRSVPSEIRHLTLGAELKLVDGEVRRSVQELFSASPQASSGSNPYLMVATFDPRKNHHYLLDAFDLIWQRNLDLRLCLVGRVGSLCEDVVQRIHSHPEFGKRLIAYHDMKDSELQHCYQSCRGVIFPSIVEGFGLPIVESLWFGKKTFASDTPIHREVGGNDCAYFDLADPETLVAEIGKWERMADSDCIQLPTRRPTTWEECSRRLIAHCVDVQQSIKSGDRRSKNAA